MLVNKERVAKEILTIHGYISYKRTLLSPADKESAKRLLEFNGQKSVCPVDDVIHHCMNDLSKAIKEKEQTRYDKLCIEFGM